MTRSRTQGAALAQLLRDRGAQVAHLPVVAFESLGAEAELRARVSTLRAGDAIAFTSANGVSYATQALADLLPQNVIVAATGSRTARACAELLQRPATCVPGAYVAEAFADALSTCVRPGGRVVVARALVARDVLPEALRAAGFEVDVVPMYRTVLDVAAAEELAAIGELDVLTFASSLTARLFDELIEATGRTALRDTPAITIGPITSDDARRLGYSVVAEAPEATAESVAGAVFSWWSRSTPQPS